MFGLFGKKKKKKTQAREDLITQAKENARKAREEIGDENLKRMAQALQRMHDPAQQSDGKRAAGQIKAMDKGHVADNLKIIMKEEK